MSTDPMDACTTHRKVNFSLKKSHLANKVAGNSRHDEHSCRIFSGAEQQRCASRARRAECLHQFVQPPPGLIKVKRRRAAERDLCLFALLLLFVRRAAALRCARAPAGADILSGSASWSRGKMWSDRRAWRGTAWLCVARGAARQGIRARRLAGRLFIGMQVSIARELGQAEPSVFII